MIELDSHPYVLLGIEKIIELGWWRDDDMIGLIYHELGHIYQMQYGTLKRSLQGGDAFLWQLFTEGIAMHFEQRLTGNPAYFHQGKNGWAAWCEANLHSIATDFQADFAPYVPGKPALFRGLGAIQGPGPTSATTWAQNLSNG